MVFRLYYYIIPLFLAGVLFTGNEILLRGGVLVRTRRSWRVQAIGALERTRFRRRRATGRSRCAA